MVAGLWAAIRTKCLGRASTVSNRGLLCSTRGRTHVVASLWLDHGAPRMPKVHPIPFYTNDQFCSPQAIGAVVAQDLR